MTHMHCKLIHLVIKIVSIIMFQSMNEIFTSVMCYYILQTMQVVTIAHLY